VTRQCRSGAAPHFAARDVAGISPEIMAPPTFETETRDEPPNNVIFVCHLRSALSKERGAYPF
jgi:hypothetical protein